MLSFPAGPQTTDETMRATSTELVLALISLTSAVSLLCLSAHSLVALPACQAYTGARTFFVKAMLLSCSLSPG